MGCAWESKIPSGLSHVSSGRTCALHTPVLHDPRITPGIAPINISLKKCALMEKSAFLKLEKYIKSTCFNTLLLVVVLKCVVTLDRELCAALCQCWAGGCGGARLSRVMRPMPQCANSLSSLSLNGCDVTGLCVRLATVVSLFLLAFT